MKNKSILKTILLVFFGIVALIFIAIPLVYWFKHPELTKMQIFLKFWIEYVLSIVFYTGFQILLKHDLTWE